MEFEKLNLTIIKTTTGTMDYLQITSEDQLSINIVLIAEKIELKDYRGEETLKKKG